MSPWLAGHPGLPRVLAGLDARGSAMTLAEHERVHGELPRRTPHKLIEEVERSGLRGRGGADFPTARKLRAVAAARREASAVVVNGSETEPASAKDRLLLSRLPHLVLDGAVLAAAAVGADRVVVCVDRTRTDALTALRRAVDERSCEALGLELHVAGTPPRYVAGEERALTHWL